ncbi:MAG: alginate export family protein [Deltaproteobacteria bacterium]|nr:alginate export family protein [Deltaproteobacteria bacterium]
MMNRASRKSARVVKSLCAVGMFSVCAYSQALAADDVASASNVAEFFKNGKAYISGRYRYEFVDQDDFDNDAKASTLQTRLGYKTANFMGFKGLLEVEDVTEIGKDLYNSTVNGRTDRPVVADPQGTEVNQAYIGYHGVPDTAVTFGRKQIVLDNVRWIGDVAWRQNNQTFDSATLSNTSVPGLNLQYGYIFNANRIFGDGSPVGDVESNSHLVNAKYTGCSLGALAAYAYMLDLEDLPAVSSNTFGARFDGKYGVTDLLSLLYDLEYAFQMDHGDNPTDYDAHYYRAEAGAGAYGFTLKGGFESLGSDEGDIAVSAPLSTTHVWNGWADKFVSTPADGLQDAYGLLGYQVSGVHELVDGLALTLVYHYFSSDEGSTDYGTEWDFNIQKALFEHYMVGIKYANYNADEFATDTQKVILTLGASFNQA